LVFAVCAIICLLSGFHVLMVATTDSAADIMAESLMKLLKEAKSSHLNRFTYIAACSKVLSWDETLRMKRLFHSNGSSVARSHARDSQAMTD